MNNRDIEWRHEKLEQSRKEIECGQLNALRELLPDEVIKQICQESGHYFRTRLLSPLATIFHMIGAGISREGSFQSSWQMSGQSGKSGVLSDARKRLPLVVWSQLHQWMMAEIAKEDEGRWRGHRMIGIDGTTASMSDEPPLVEYFGRWNSKHGPGRFPNARVVVTFNLETLINVTHRVGAYRCSEKKLTQALLKDLQAGDVLVFDCLYAGAHLYVLYQRAGIEFIGQAHACLNVANLKVVEQFDGDDLLVELVVDRKYLQQDPSLPQTIRVRMIKSCKKIQGKSQVFWVATSLIDPKKYPKEEIKAWQKNRWKIETLIEEMKIWMGADILRSKSVEGIHKELYARIVGLNLIHWLIIRTARRHNQAVQRLSVSAALRLAASYSLKMSAAPAWQLPLLYDQMLERIAASAVPCRPNRLEPRMKKREPRKYPRLRMPRAKWKELYAVAA